jgi:hypothetical protein
MQTEGIQTQVSLTHKVRRRNAKLLRVLGTHAEIKGRGEGRERSPFGQRALTATPPRIKKQTSEFSYTFTCWKKSRKIVEKCEGNFVLISFSQLEFKQEQRLFECLTPVLRRLQLVTAVTALKQKKHRRLNETHNDRKNAINRGDE